MTSRRLLFAGIVGSAALCVGGVAAVQRATTSPPPPPRGSAVAALLAAPARAGNSPPALASKGAAEAAAGDSSEQNRRTASATAAPSLHEGLRVAFPLDPRLTRGLHMGTRWVSPRTWVGGGSGSLFVVQAAARRADGSGGVMQDPTWLAAEPDMVAVTPDHGGRVEITVLREGRSTLTVAEGGASRTLTVNAAHRDGVWRVEITQ